MKLFLKRNSILFTVLLVASFNVYADDAPLFSTPSRMNEQFAATNSPSPPNESTAQPPQPPSPALTGDRETVIKENLTHTGPEGGLSVDKLPPVYSTDKK